MPGVRRASAPHLLLAALIAWLSSAGWQRTAAMVAVPGSPDGNAEHTTAFSLRITSPAYLDWFWEHTTVSLRAEATRIVEYFEVEIFSLDTAERIAVARTEGGFSMLVRMPDGIPPGRFRLKVTFYRTPHRAFH